MSKQGRILLLFSFLFFAGLCILRIVYGGWQNTFWMWGLLALSFTLGIGALVIDRREIVQFFGAKSTKHGLNMGALILISVVGLGCLNYLSVRYDKKLDWTSEKLNSLSDQAVKVVDGLKEPIKLVLLYKPDQQQDGNLQKSVRDLAALFIDRTSKIQYEAYNAYERPDLAKKYDYTIGPFGFYALQGESRVKIEKTTEEGITQALMKFGRERRKTIYFIQGHGERDLEDKGFDGLSELKSSLEVTYDPKPLVLFAQKNEVPADAEAVAIIGPEGQYLEPELQALRAYARRGGHFFIALEPGKRHNLAQLTKSLGVEFNNDYVLDPRTEQLRMGPTFVLGSTFSAESEITRSFAKDTFAFMKEASSVRRAPGAPDTLSFEDIVQTDTVTMSVANLNEQTRFEPNGPQTLAIWVEGTLAPESGVKDAPTPKPFSALVVGDSDFIANRLVHNNLNKDLSLNAFAALLQDKDLISIRPKQPKGTALVMTDVSFALYLLLFLILLPVLFFLAGGFVWWRRRAA